jgi:hypothetical protein
MSILYEVATLSIYFTFRMTWRSINHGKNEEFKTRKTSNGGARRYRNIIGKSGTS